jgi:hypothetical protein
MDTIKVVERVLYGENGHNLVSLKNLRVSFGSLAEAKGGDGQKVMQEVVTRIDLLEPNSLGARWRRLLGSKK